MGPNQERNKPFLRVLQLGPWAPPHGGVQTNLAAIHQSLLARGADSRVINIAHARKDSVPNIYFPRNVFALVVRLASLPSDIVHLHVGDIRPALIGLAALVSALPGRRSVLTFHSGRYGALRRQNDYRHAGALAATLNRFDAVICVNSQLLDFLAAQGVRAGKLHFIGPYPGVPLGSLPPLADPVAAFAAKHKPLIVAVGLMEREYNVPFLFDAIAKLRAHDPRAGLVVIGEGRLSGDFEQQRRRHPAADSILLAGDLPRELTLSTIARSAAMLRATSWDGDSVSVREAVDLGVPVVASDNGLRPPQVRCYSPGNVDDCVARLLEGIRQGPLASGDARAPANDNDDNDDNGDNIEKVIALYECLVGRASTEREIAGMKR